MQVKIRMIGVANLNDVEVLVKWDSHLLPLIGHEIDLNLFSSEDRTTEGSDINTEQYKKYLWKVESISWTKYSTLVTPVLKVRASVKM